MTPERYKNAADFLLSAVTMNKAEPDMKIDLAIVRSILEGLFIFERPDMLTLTEKGRNFGAD